MSAPVFTGTKADAVSSALQNLIFIAHEETFIRLTWVLAEIQPSVFHHPFGDEGVRLELLLQQVDEKFGKASWFFFLFWALIFVFAINGVKQPALT